MSRQHAHFIDYLRYTVPHGTEPREYLPPFPEFQETGEQLNTLPNYTHNKALLCARVDWHPERPEQKIMITLAGKDLQRMRGMGLSDTMLLNWITPIAGLSVTRLDVAIDTNDTRINPAAFAQDWNKSRIETRARTLSEVTGTGQGGKYKGHTVYLGSRTSEQFLRVYDKAAEQGTEGHLTRIELELKGHKAFEAVHHLAGGEFNARARHVITRFFKWPNAGWQDLIAGASDEVERLSEPDKDGRQAWLRRVALPAVIEAYLEGDDIVTLKIDAAWAQKRNT